MVDESKIIEGTAKGHGSVSVKDVSEIPHEIGVKLIGEPVFTGGGLLEGGYFEDTDFGFIRSSPFIGTNEVYTLALNLVDTEKLPFYDVYYASADWNGHSSPGIFDLIDGTTFKSWSTIGTYEKRIFISNHQGLTASDILSASLDVGDNVTAPDPMGPDFSGVKVTVNGTEYTANAEGTVEGIKSISPEMTVSADADCDIELSYRKSFGMHTERQRFWEEFQRGGKRTHYYGFSEQGEFTDETYNPLYPLTVSNGYCMFSNNNRVTDTKVPIILIGTADYSFSNTKLKRIHSIDFTNISKITSFFYLAYDIEECNVVGTIKKDGIYLGYSNKLSHDSLMSFVNALEDLTESGTTKTITFGATNLAKLTEEEKAIITNKGWTYS